VAATYTVRGGLRSYFGTSADEKEDGGVPNGSSFTEMDTGARFLFDEENGVWRKQPAVGSGSGSGSSGVTGHQELSGRDAPGQHPISAVTGLEAALAAKLGADGVAQAMKENVQEISEQDVLNIWNQVMSV